MNTIFLSSPRGSFVLQTEISGKYIQLFVFDLISVISVSIFSPFRENLLSIGWVSRRQSLASSLATVVFSAVLPHKINRGISPA